MKKLSYPTWSFPEVIRCSSDCEIPHVAQGTRHHGFHHIIEVAGGIVMAWIQPLHCTCGAEAWHSGHHSRRVLGGPEPYHNNRVPDIQTDIFVVVVRVESSTTEEQHHQASRC
ncbi:hypothetical protein E2C01_027385 [Portunus trituberculatus]|uniref:Uncharacterized protein n=1 Tax=Portunus trituberculatus TaxID=210409 RepID=A0A5B7ENL8_PORTR|nr:hypothetical protein [Portunus trituberculatus]